MGGLDVGQSITVRDQTVLGVEAVEGTDALIARTGSSAKRRLYTGESGQAKSRHAF